MREMKLISLLPPMLIALIGFAALSRVMTNIELLATLVLGFVVLFVVSEIARIISAQPNDSDAGDPPGGIWLGDAVPIPVLVNEPVRRVSPAKAVIRQSRRSRSRDDVTRG